MPDPTQILVQRAAAGDREAVELLIEENLPGLRAFVRLRAGALVRAKEAESDIVQSVCLDVLEHMGNFRYAGEGAFKCWLYTTALRKIVNKDEYYRAAKRDAMREERPAAGPGSNPDGDAGLLACYASFVSPSDQAIAHEEVARIEQAFASLSEEYRDAIVLSRIVGLSRLEIAAEMNKSETAVSSLIYRGLTRLSEILEKQERGKR